MRLTHRTEMVTLSPTLPVSDFPGPLDASSKSSTIAPPPESMSGTACSRRAQSVTRPAAPKSRAEYASPHVGPEADTKGVGRIATASLIQCNGTQQSAVCAPELHKPGDRFGGGTLSLLHGRGFSRCLRGVCMRRLLAFGLLAAALGGCVSVALAISEDHVGSNIGGKNMENEGTASLPVSGDTADPISSLLEVVEERKRAWALSLSKRRTEPPAIHCGSALYGGTRADGTRFVEPEEAANCRSLCRALLHKRGGFCAATDDPHACLMSYRSDEWVPEEYKQYCIYTKPTVQQPDFEKSNCSDDCLSLGMNAWLYRILHGDVSWDSFMEDVPSSCEFKSIGPEASRLAVRAHRNYSESTALNALIKTEMTRFHIITRKLFGVANASAQLAESTVVPGAYWDAMSAADRLDWTVTYVFYAPADDTNLSELRQKLTGSPTGEAICLFKTTTEDKERFGMIPGRTCRGSIGVLLVAALTEHAPKDFDAAFAGFDLCVARRAFQGKKAVDDSDVESLQLKTRVTIGTPCGISSGLESGMWEVAFYASMYPQARGIDGMPSSGECPWKGSFQLNSKCFLKPKLDTSSHKLDFFSANAACGELAEGTGFAPEDASLATICSDRELNFVGEMVSEGSESWIGLFQPGQFPFISPGRSEAYRLKEAQCPLASLVSPDGWGSPISVIKSRCQAARSWPSWKAVVDHGVRTSWDATFCDSHPQTRDELKFADCASVTVQPAGPPCLKARRCDAAYSAVCSLKLRTGPEIISTNATGGSDLPILPCKPGSDCWLELSLPTIAGWTNSLAGRPSMGRAHAAGFLALMLFCGAGAVLAGPWSLVRRINIGNDSSYRDLADGVYEICFCSPVQVGDAMVSCTDGKEFRYIRGLLWRSQGTADSSRLYGMSKVSIRPLQGAATETDPLFMLQQANEISPGVVYCSVGGNRRTDSTCRFTLSSTSSAEQSVALSFVPVSKPADGTALCTYPGVNMTVLVKGRTEIEVPSLIPSSIKYGVCADGKLLGTLINSARMSSALDLPDGGVSVADQSFLEAQVGSSLKLASIKVLFPDNLITNAAVEVTIGGYRSKKTAEAAVLILIEAKSLVDTACPSDLLKATTGPNTYKGDYLQGQGLLVFRFVAPTVRMKMCLINTSWTSRRRVVLGHAPAPATPQKAEVAEARCSLSPTGDCQISLYPDLLTKATVAPFYRKTMAVKLLKGKVACPESPDDPQYDAFTGDPDDTSALLNASTVNMTQTFADTSMVEFVLEKKLRRWLADAGVASICMTQVGLPSASTVCRTFDACTAHLGYMRWTGPTGADPDKRIVCKEGAECIVDVQGKNMNFLSMSFSRLAALDACGKIAGEGTLPIVGVFEGVDPSAPSDVEGFLQLTASGGMATSENGVHASGAPVDTKVTSPSRNAHSTNDAQKAEVHVQAGTKEPYAESLLQVEADSTMDSNKISFLIKCKSPHDSLELCWNPAAGARHNLLDHTISMGRVFFISHPVLKSMNLRGYNTEPARNRAVVISIDTSMSRFLLFGSTKLYFKDGPTDGSLVDTCNYQVDEAANLITTFVSPSEVVETANDRRVGHYVSLYPTVPTSVCLVEFLMPSNIALDLPYTTYLGRLPGVMMPSSDLDIYCTADSTVDCRGRAPIRPRPGLDQNGNPLPIVAVIPTLHVVLVSSDSCPSTPDKIELGIPTEGKEYAERHGSRLTADSLEFNIEVLSMILAYRGKGAVCAIDNDCKGPQEKGCVSSLGIAMWVGPPVNSSINVTCTRLEAGRCEATVPGHHMDHPKYNVARVAVAKMCGGSQDPYFGMAINKKAEGRQAVFAVPAQSTWELTLCWNPRQLIDEDSALQAQPSDFYQWLGVIHYMPLPVFTGYSVSRTTAVEATVIIKVNALLDQATAEALGGKKPDSGLWNGITRQPFTDGATCDSRSAPVQINPGVSMEIASIRDRREGSSQETGSDSTDALVAVLSLQLDAEVDPYTYCWHTIVMGGNSSILKEIWTPLISLPRPSDAHLGGSPSAAAISLGFVPCMSGITDSAACNFSLLALDQTDSAFFPRQTPWILPRKSTVILLPGDTECPDEQSDTFKVAVPVDASTLDPNVPLLLKPEAITDEHVWYRFEAARAWLSENTSGTICWRNDLPLGKVVKISRALWLGPLYTRQPMRATCSDTAVCTVWVHGKNLTKLDHSISRVAILKKCGVAEGPGIARMRSTNSGSASFITLASSDAPSLVTADNLEPVHFWTLPGKVFQSHCKHGTSPEFLEAKWIDIRGICDQMDIASLLNTQCNGVKWCTFIPLGSKSAGSRNGSEQGLRLLIPDSCDDFNSRKLLGTYRCVDTRAFSKSQHSSRQPGSAPAMLQLWSREDDQDDDGSTVRPDAVLPDQKMSFWIPREKPGVYEICWNSELVPSNEPTAFSESLGLLEILPSLSIVDEAVVCASESLTSCSLEITIGTEAVMNDNNTMALVIAEQDGKATCEEVVWEQVKDVAIMPHQSSWDSWKSRTELTYTAALPMESGKLCLVNLHSGAFGVGAVQYAGNIPGYSAPKEQAVGQNICTTDPSVACAVSLVPEDASKYFVLDNRTPVEDESSPTFDAFVRLRPYLEPSSRLYALEGDVSCPASPTDAAYTGAAEAPLNGIAQLVEDSVGINSSNFQVTDEQKTWLSSVLEVSLCWVVPSCTEDSFKSGSRPCTKKVGVLSWAGPDLKQPLPTVVCKRGELCTFEVKGFNLALLDHEKSRVAFKKDCADDKGPGIGRITKYPPGYHNTSPKQRLGASRNRSSFLSLKSRFARQWKSPRKHRLTRPERLHRLEKGILSLLQEDTWQASATADSLTVVSPVILEDTFSVCWNPLLTPTDNLSDFTVEVGKATGYAITPIDKFCTSGSTCGIQVTTRGSMLDPTKLKFRAFNGQCGSTSDIPQTLPDEGQYTYIEDTAYSLAAPVATGSQTLQSYSLCWCDEIWTPACEVSDYVELVGSLAVQVLEEKVVTCLKKASAFCGVSIPLDMKNGTVYFAEMTSTTPSSCTTPLMMLYMTQATITNDGMDFKFSYDHLDSAGLSGKAIALCWTEKAIPSGVSIPVWNSSFLGNIATVDPDLTVKALYAGIPPRIGLNVTGLIGEQASSAGLPNSLRKLYIKDKGMCSAQSTTISVPMDVQPLSSLNGELTFQIIFVASEAPDVVLSKDMTVVAQLSLCWCNSGLPCASSDEFDSEIQKVIFRGPGRGVKHECTHDTTCLMKIEDIPGLASLPFTPQLLIRTDCADPKAETALPDQGVMSLRKDTVQPSEQADDDVVFEEHSYGFKSRVIRGESFAEVHQLQKRICYCTDSNQCLSGQLVELGKVTITDVWNTEFRVTIIQPINLPFTPKHPLHQQDSNRVVRVTRGSYVEDCSLAISANTCTISLLSFPEETWSSEDLAFLEYYDSSILPDSLDNRPLPFVQIASLTPAGPTKSDYLYFCLVGGICEVRADLINRRTSDKVAMLPQCGQDSPDLLGFSEPAEAVNNNSRSTVFRWSKRLDLSEAEMKSGFEVCWKAVEDQAHVSDSITEYSAKFGTVSIRGIFPNQNKLCYIGAVCKVEDLRAQNLEGDSKIKLLNNGCGSEGSEWAAIPNSGIMTMESATDEYLTVGLPGMLPIIGTTSLLMCSCTDPPCAATDDFGWRIGRLEFRGPRTFAPHVSAFPTEDVRLSLAGDFDDKFYLVLKNGMSCAKDLPISSLALNGFAPVVNGTASWSGFGKSLGPLSACICHDTVAGLSDPFGNPHEPRTVCEDMANYASKVGQLFISGPLTENAMTSCRTGFICEFNIRWVAEDSEDIRDKWARSQIYAQPEPCNVRDTAVLFGGSFISDNVIGDPIISTDPTYPISYEQRESTFMFYNPVEVGAGNYHLCWKLESSTVGLTLGSFNVEGPIAQRVIVPVVIGQLFDVEIQMTIPVTLEEAQKYRIRAHAYQGDDIFENFECKSQLSTSSSDAFDTETADGPPKAVRSTPRGTILIWENVRVTVDELVTEATAGDMYAVCFCDGAGLGCDTPDRFQTLVQAWTLSGPKAFKQTVQPRYRAGARFTLDISGVQIQEDPVIVFSPAFSLVDNKRFSCRSSEKELLGRSVGSVSEDRSMATFEDVFVPFTIPQGLLCWCPGSGSCSKPADFNLQLGRFSVAGPTFIMPRAVVGSYFTIQLIGSTLHQRDIISIRSTEDTCGEPGTEVMDPKFVEEEPGRPLNRLGTVESFSTSDNAVTGDTEMTWTSWAMRIKDTADRRLKICYCSFTAHPCVHSGSTSIFAGLLEIRGPSKGDIELVASEEHGEYLIVRGTSLSTRNMLRYFQYPAGQGPPTPEQEAEMCIDPINQATAITAFPDAVNASGTEEYFSVTVAVGKQYVACWSFGEDTSSVASHIRSGKTAPSFLPIDERILTRKVAVNGGTEAPQVATVSESGGQSDLATASEQRTTPTSSTADSKKWFYVSLFSQTGFQQGIHNVVIGHEDTVVVNGVINATDTYTAVLGSNHEMSDCTDIFKDSSLQSDISLTTFSVSNSRMVLQMKPASQSGWHKLCIKNTTASVIFDAGTVEVTTYFQKTGMDMYDTRRTFVLPCVTGTNDSSGRQVWPNPQVWLPDGIGLWNARIVARGAETDKEYSTLDVNSTPSNNFREFPELRNVLACDTTKDQAVLVLGATHMLVIYPVVTEKESVLINHGVPYPADLTSANDQVFITSFDSHLITSLSLNEPNKIIFYEPSNPTLLSAGGIQVRIGYQTSLSSSKIVDLCCMEPLYGAARCGIPCLGPHRMEKTVLESALFPQAIQNIDGNETSIFVADTVGGMIGRLQILPDDLKNTPHGGVLTRDWTAVFGKQKSDFRNTEGVNRPFCIGEFVTTYSTQEKMNPLLLVGELISDRITFLSLDGKDLSFYRQINLGVTKFITGLRVTDEVMLLTSKQWSVEQELGKAEVVYITLSQLIDNVYFTYPDFTKKLQAGLRYRFLPLVTGHDIQFFKEDAVAGDPLQSMGFTLDSKTGEIQGVLTATVTSKVVIVGGDLLGSYTWSFEFEAGCQSGEYFNESSNSCEPCPLGTFRDEETELQNCRDHKAYSTTLQTGSTNLSQCACIEGYEIGHLGYCQPCPSGTYKAIAADAKCTGRCPQHMSSDRTGSESLEALNCQCDPGFYLTNDGCQSCQIGTYCEGKLSPPVQCPEFQTTSAASSSSFSDCVCTAGYYRHGQDCIPCDILTYKPLIGDNSCTQCPQPAVNAAANSPILSTSSPETSMFSSRKGAVQQSECEVCASGYYFDSVSMGGCVPCKKDYYCPGFQLGMLSCKNNSVTTGIGAETVFQCGCPKGYGKSATRNPLNLSIICTPCPNNYFQHIEGADTECIPCPANSMTKSTMSTSITSCIAKPGFSAIENLQALTNGEDVEDTDGPSSMTFLDAIDLAKDVEKAYETLTEEDIQAINVFCKEGIDAAQDYDMAEFVTMLYTSSLEECQRACLKNVYCTSFSFSKEDRYPTHTNSVMNYTGIYTYTYWPCRLYLFGGGAAADVERWTDVWQGNEVEPGKAVGCVVGRVNDELVWQRFRYVECPPNAYCPGDKEASIFECKDYAVTLSSGAYSADHCLCVPGREPVGHLCEQCKVGFYKNTTENVACTECPQFFTTSITASTSAYECVCQSGMYMAPVGTTDGGEANGPPEDSEAQPVGMEVVAQARSLRELGKHGELPPLPPGGVSMAELLRLPWLEEDTRDQLERVVELGVCVPCHQGMFCPGLWKDPPTNSTHMPPQQCIEGSSVPLSTVNADSVEKCLCLAGYAYGRSSDSAETSESYFTCSRCSPGTYKELQENAPCSGRCMKDAETYPGAVSKSQCFCQVGRYAVESNDSEGLYSCVECVVGGVCIGGFKQNVIKAIASDAGYSNITILDHTIPYPQKGWFATFKPISQAAWKPDWVPFIMDSSDTSKSGIFDLNSSNSGLEGSDVPTSFVENQYDRIPDIHPCPIDYRCHGGPTNACAEGGTGYLCSRCERGYDMAHHGAVCSKCESLWVMLGWVLASRTILCIIVWIIASVTCLAVQNPACIHPILIRIWLSNFFLFFLFGFFPENSVSALAGWAPAYRAFFTYPIFIFTRYPKVFCLLDKLGIPLDFKQSWYLQKFAQMLVPIADVCILILMCGVSLGIYKLYKHSKIQRVKLVLSHARDVHSGDIWAMRTVEKIQDTRCLGLFHYISPPNATSGQKVLRFFGDLVPAFMIIWFWNLPFLVIECTQLLGCVSISYKTEPPLVLLTAMPEQQCSLQEPWFLAGLIIGASGILVWGIGSVIVFCFWMLYTDNADKVESRFRYGFLSNGYEFQYRAWEMLLMARKLACACLLTLQLHMNASGTQEIFRNSINLLIATICLILQLLIEPYDRRSHNLTNRVEFLGLLTNVVNCIIIQGSFSFSIFKWLGPLPLITCGIFHSYVFWSLFVEAGRMVLMRPHLARLPSPWRYFNLVTRSLARLYTRGNAKIYYNYITKEMVLEAAAKSRVFHLRRMIQKRTKSTEYRKINYENRSYFVSALTDSLSRLVISWCQFTIPGDWLDFTIRYSFCYCFWMRHRAASLREPLDLEEFDAMRPSLFNECYVETEDRDDDGLLAIETECNEVEAEFLDMMVDDDVYDDSPITLMELYVAVQSMRYIPRGQLRRLHMWYRERMAATGSSDVPALRKENEELEAELQELSAVLRNRFGATDEMAQSFNILDFFFTVEMVHEAEAENVRIRKEIDKEIANILSARAALAVAQRVHMELEKADGEELEDVLRSVEDSCIENSEKAKKRLDYLEPALLATKKKVKTREKATPRKPKRRISRLVADRPKKAGAIEEGKRVIRPSFSSREGKAQGKKKLSLLTSQESTSSMGRKTVSPLGFGHDREKNGSSRRISLSLELGGSDGNGGPEDSREKPARRISLTLTPEEASDHTQQASGSSDEGGSTRGPKRTLRSSSMQKYSEESAPQTEKATTGRTLRSASIQSRSEEPPSGEAKGESTESKAQGRRVARIGTASTPEEPQPESGDSSVSGRQRSVGLFKKPPDQKKDTP